MEQKKWAPVKEILFTYLAINKIMYWYGTIISMNQSELGNVSQAILIRFLEQDLLLIIAVVAFYFLNVLIESKKAKPGSTIGEYVIFYSIGYVVLLGIGFIYFCIMLFLISPVEGLTFTEFTRQFIGVIPGFTLSYLVIAAVLEVKLYFKKKGAESSKDTTANSTEDKLAMLKALLDDGILTTEEFENKKQILFPSQ